MIDLTRRLIWFDLETTGLDVKNDRIVSLAFTEYFPDRTKAPREYAQLLNPTIPIPATVTQIHGLTDADVVGKPTFADLAPSLLRGFQACDYGGYNVKYYDLPLLAAEFARAGHPWSYTDASIIDVMRLWDVLERRTLIRAVDRFLGRSHEGAHGAQADIAATIQVFEAMITQFGGKLPATVADLHAFQWPHDPNAIDPDGKILWRQEADGWCAVMNFGKNWKGKRLDAMTRRDLEWIVSPACAGASDTVKQICAQALKGNFPTRKI